MKSFCYSLFLITLFAASSSFGQISGRQSRKSATLSGNNIKTALGNWGVIGQPGEFGSRGAWMYSTNGYIGDASFLIGIELPIRDYNNDGTADTVHSVVVCPVARPQVMPRSEDPITGKPWGFEPVSGFFAAPPNQSIAIRTQPQTWPLLWPDHPEWGSGVWNGLNGANTFVGNEEAYFVLDDNNNEDFNFAQNNPNHFMFLPDSTNPARHGQGIRMSVRYIQSAHPLLKDMLFKVYDIKNESRHHYSKMFFGTLTGTYVGVTSTEDAGEYNDDASVLYRADNYTLSWDFDENTLLNVRWRGRVGKFSEAFVHAPSQNKIASFDYFTPASSLSFGNDEALWRSFKPGTFRVPSSIVQDTIALRGTDGDYHFGSEYFSLDPGETERIVSVIAYGYSKNEILPKILTARAFWNSGFDTTTVANSIRLQNFGAHRTLTGIVPVSWTTQGAASTIDLWFSPDAGRSWRALTRNHPTASVFQWTTTSVEDCAFGLLKVFVKDMNGNVFGLNQTPTFFSINNTQANGSPFIGIKNEEFGSDTTFVQTNYPVRLLMGDPESSLLSITAFYRTNETESFRMFDSYPANPDTNEQIYVAPLSRLPNSENFQFKFVATDESSSWIDTTVAFKKQTPRAPISSSYFRKLSGFSEIPVQIRIIDSARIRSDRYIITFDDTSSFTQKSFSVFNQTRSSYVIRNSQIFPNTETVSFDGLTIYAEDTTTSWDQSRSYWPQRLDLYVERLNTMGADGEYRGYGLPSDYRVIFYDTIVDTTDDFPPLGLPPIPINYHVWNLQSGLMLRVVAAESGGMNEIVLKESVGGTQRFTWNFSLMYFDTTAPHLGDTLNIITKKGLSFYDSLEVSGLPTSVGESSTLPLAFRLDQNYPNPFNPTTTIRYELPVESKVTLRIFNILGQQVKTLVNGLEFAGVKTVVWDGKNNGGNVVASGVYFYRLEAEGSHNSISFAQIRKMILLR